LHDRHRARAERRPAGAPTCRSSRHSPFPAVSASAADGAEPEYKDEKEYPEWLWKLLEDKPLLEDYVMKGLENVPQGRMKSVFRMASKRKIKEGNAAREKTA
jgi:hypothetical protein